MLRRMGAKGAISHKSWALDGVRAAAALAVVAYHVRGSAWVKFDLLPPSQHSVLARAFFAPLRLGDEAVMVFFVLSGFLVGGRIVQKVTERAFSLGDYAIERSTRIFIPLIPAVVLTDVVNGIVFGHADVLWSVLANIPGLDPVAAPTLSRDPPLWSLAYEIWFYTIAGALAAIVATRWRIASFLMAGFAMGVLVLLGKPYLLFWAVGAFAFVLRRPAPLGLLAICGTPLLIVGVVLMQFTRDHAAPLGVFNHDVAAAILCLGMGACLPALRDFQPKRELRLLETGARN
jgi:peptidoglycan/LPS O-acetylase OafA/YrhL